MSVQFQSWVVFGLSFMASAGILGFFLISRSEVQHMLDWMQADGSINDVQQNSDIEIPISTSSQPSWADHIIAIDPLADEDEFEDADEFEDEEALEEEVKETRRGLMTFLEGSIAGMIKGGFQLDSINKFGCHLFLAGACEAQARTSGLNKEQFVELLAKSVSVLGSSPSIAHKFGEKYEEYLLEPRSAEMFKAGGNAIEKFMSGADGGADELRLALKKWSTPDKGSQGSSLKAVLFTDIVGSTKMNQDYGDAAAQRAIHDHNSIVRAALQNYKGNEVKHTGDGIMASFSSSVSAVEAGVEIIKGIRFRSNNSPEVPLKLRIGINAGQPISEDDGDLSGSTVQVAAQLCDAANTDGICVTQVVRELCAGKELSFEPMGDVTLKGLKEPTALFNVKI